MSSQRAGILHFVQNDAFNAQLRPVSHRVGKWCGGDTGHSKKGECIMDKTYKIVAVEQPEWGIIGQGIRQYNTQQAGEDHGKNED